MLCLVARFEDQILRFPLPDEQVVIGSLPESDICLPFPGVSKRHARMLRDGERVTLQDLGSKNHLIVEHQRVDEVQFDEGVEVQIGRAFLTVEDTDTSDVELALRTAGREIETPSTATDEVPLTGDGKDSSPGAALHFIREIEMASKGDLRKNRENWLARAAAILRCRMLMVLEISAGGDMSLIASSGKLPEGIVLDDVGRCVSAKKPGDPPRLETLRGHRFAFLTSEVRRKRRGLVARFGSGLDSLEPWMVDFLDFLGRRFINANVASRSSSEVGPEETLVVPEGMVVGNSEAIQGLLRQIRATVQSRIDVLLWGETGTGKELFARMIHQSGPTRTGRFVAINCAAIPNELLEAELFGVKGRVATGVDPRPGLFLEAHGGTIFLDEIGELAAPLQAKLLRVLQEREVLQLGSSRPLPIDVRVISASNSNLLDRVEEARFRADLYYRLRGLQFHIPPLRDRKDDIPDLLLSFVHRFAERHSKRVEGVSRKALSALLKHRWPGNIRELQSEVERAVLVCPDGGTLGVDHFATVLWSIKQHESEGDSASPERELPTPAASEIAAPTEFVPLQVRIDHVELEAINQALRITRGNKTRSAELLGITRNGLAMKMKRLGMDIPGKGGS